MVSATYEPASITLRWTTSRSPSWPKPPSTKPVSERPAYYERDMIRKLRHASLAVGLALALGACAVGVRSSASTSVGGGPAQSTSQALVVMQSTTTAFATASAGQMANAVPCDCEATK
jgi:hypothetical protein